MRRSRYTARTGKEKYRAHVVERLDNNISTYIYITTESNDRTVARIRTGLI